MSDRRGREWLRRAGRGEPFTDWSSRPCTGSRTSAATRVRIVELRRHMQRYKELSAQGKLAEAGKELEAIQALLEK